MKKLVSSMLLVGLMAGAVPAASSCAMPTGQGVSGFLRGVLSFFSKTDRAGGIEEGRPSPEAVESGSYLATGRPSPQDVEEGRYPATGRPSPQDVEEGRYQATGRPAPQDVEEGRYPAVGRPSLQDVEEGRYPATGCPAPQAVADGSYLATGRPSPEAVKNSSYLATGRQSLQDVEDGRYPATGRPAPHHKTEERRSDKGYVVNEKDARNLEIVNSFQRAVDNAVFVVNILYENVNNNYEGPRNVLKAMNKTISCLTKYAEALMKDLKKEISQGKDVSLRYYSEKLSEKLKYTFEKTQRLANSVPLYAINIKEGRVK